MLRRMGAEHGMTVIEVTVVMALLLTVLGVFLGVLDSVNRGVMTQQQRSQANDQARLAIEQLDREIRSGNVLYDPANETPAADRGYTLRIYTQANATTRVPPLQCVQWRMEDKQLIRRAWPVGRPGEVTAWRIIADDIVNRDLSPPVPAFTLDPDPAKGGRTVNIVLMADADPSETISRPVRVQTSLTGRNTTYNYAANVCDPAPAG